MTIQEFAIGIGNAYWCAAIGLLAMSLCALIAVLIVFCPTGLTMPPPVTRSANQ